MYRMAETVVMPEPKNAMDIYRFLEKSNCRECGEKTCLAFAGAVFMGTRSIAQCPRLDPEIQKRFSSAGGDAQATIEQNRDDSLDQLKSQVAGIDLAEAATRTGGDFTGDRLTLKVLGKNFSIDTGGSLYADIHVNPWVAGPFLAHILYGKGLLPIGEWVSFRELRDGKERYPLFQKRCEEPMKQVADTYTDLFDDMVHLFNGRQVARQFRADISVVLAPLPRVPIMVCYWAPEGAMASSLNVYFDKTAEENLDNGSLFSLGAGLAVMFGKLALRHGFENLRQ